MHNATLIPSYAFLIIAHLWLTSDKPHAIWFAIGHAVFALIFMIADHASKKNTSNNAD